MRFPGGQGSESHDRGIFAVNNARRMRDLKTNAFLGGKKLTYIDVQWGLGWTKYFIFFALLVTFRIKN